jgi:hypothetical protein
MGFNRRNRVTSKMVDRDFPFQVELPQPPRGFGTRLNELHAIARDLGVPSTTRGVITYPYEGLRWCFTTPEAADAFLALLAPADYGTPVDVASGTRA